MFAKRRVAEFVFVATLTTLGSDGLNRLMTYKGRRDYKKSYPSLVQKSRVYAEADTALRNSATIEPVLNILGKLGPDEPCTARAGGEITKRNQGNLIVSSITVDKAKLADCIMPRAKPPFSPEQWNREENKAEHKLPSWPIYITFGLVGAALVTIKPVEYRRFFANLRRRNVRPSGSTPA